MGKRNHMFTVNKAIMQRCARVVNCLMAAGGRTLQGSVGSGEVRATSGAPREGLMVPTPPSLWLIFPHQCCLVPSQKGAGRGKKRHNNMEHTLESILEKYCIINTPHPPWYLDTITRSHPTGTRSALICKLEGKEVEIQMLTPSKVQTKDAFLLYTREYTRIWFRPKVKRTVREILSHFRPWQQTNGGQRSPGGQDSNVGPEGGCK